MAATQLMNPACPELTTEERATARALWQALITARTQQARDQAQQQITEMAPHIQQAMINAIAQAVRDERNIHPYENPFD